MIYPIIERIAKSNDMDMFESIASLVKNLVLKCNDNEIP
jgi:hypothetical protein